MKIMEKSMKYTIGKHKVSGLLVVALVLLTSCQSDGGDTVDTPRQSPTMEMQVSATAYIDAMPKASTRAGETWTPPSGFTLYTGHDDIRVAFTQGNSIAKGAKKTETDPERDAKGNFTFYKGDPNAQPTPIPDKWGANFPLPAAIDPPYYLYGYMPAYGDLSELDPKDGENGVSGNYADGAKMKITGLPTATSSDVCVIVGVSKGTSPTVDGGIQVGQFGYTIDGGQNHVFLLCDHIYAALRLYIRMAPNDPTYNSLRRIKLKKVWVKDCKRGDKKLTSKTNVVVNLQATDGSSPIQNVTFENDDNNSVFDMEQSPLYKAEGNNLLLTTSYQDVQGCMAPIGITEFTLVCQYEVYDADPIDGHPVNLIRKDEAENKINISNLFIATSEFQRGTRYTLYLTVRPTYLYMLSEPDLNNPTFEVES